MFVQAFGTCHQDGWLLQQGAWGYSSGPFLEAVPRCAGPRCESNEHLKTLLGFYLPAQRKLGQAAMLQHLQRQFGKKTKSSLHP